MRRADLADDDMSEGGLGEMVARLAQWAAARPRAVSIAVAGLAVVGYATLNALAFQDRPHPSAFFETRAQNADRRFALRPDEQIPAPARSSDQTVTRIVFDDQTASAAPQVPQPQIVPETTRAHSVPVARPTPDAVADPIVELQTMLAALGHYGGSIDGLKGPQTRTAIDDYKSKVGLRGIDLTVDELLTSLRNNTTITAAIPRPRPESEVVSDGGIAAAPATSSQTAAVGDVAEQRIASANTAAAPDPMVMRVQAGLRAFGNAAITVDGIAGSQTSAAIREFQALFRLPVTGEIDDDLVAKMAAVGLID